MFTIADDDVEALRQAFAKGGRDAAMVELRRRWKGLNDSAAAEVLARLLE